MDSLNKREENLDEETYELYDRNIRLWGKENQIKLNQSNVLLINLNSVITELAKNLVLAGVNLFLYDKQENGITNLITKDDIRTNFFLDEDLLESPRVEVLKQKIGAINSFVKVQELESLEDLNDIQCVCLGYKNQELMNYYGEIMTIKNIPLFSIESNQIYGVFYNNILSSQVSFPNEIYETNSKFKFRTFSFKEYLNDLIVKMSNSRRKKSKKKFYKDYLSISICILEIIRRKVAPSDIPVIIKNTQLLEKFFNEENFSLIINDEIFLEIFRKLLTNSRIEFSPVNSVLAGIVSQEVLNVLTNPNNVHKGLYIYDVEQQFGDFL